MRDGTSASTNYGEIGDHNKVDNYIYEKFVNYDPKNAKFDLRPNAVSSAAQAGSKEMAPKEDILGRPRIAPIDIGAFAR